MKIRHAAMIVIAMMLVCLAMPVHAEDKAKSTPLVTKKAATKIVGGEEAEPGAYPWIVALVDAEAPSNYDGQFCGGSVIHSKWVVTAAHCVEGVTDSGEIEVAHGIHNLEKDTVERIKVKRIYTHSSYNGETMDSDIALLELEQDLPETVTPIELFDKQDTGNLKAMVLGWGNTSAADEVFVDTLQQAVVPIVTNDECNAAYDNAITENMVCAGYARGGKDSCQGDSGGPLVVKDGDNWKLAGIVSWGEGCAQPGYYGVYTRVSRFIDYIDRAMEGKVQPDDPASPPQDEPPFPDDDPKPDVDPSQDGTPGDSCGDNMVFDCAGNCVEAEITAQWTGDGVCDNGEFGIDLTCSAFDNDGGDCEASDQPGTPGQSCGAGMVYDCAMECVDAATVSEWTGDGICDDGQYDIDLSCESFEGDGGDCGDVNPPADPQGCGAGMVTDCTGNCVEAAIVSQWTGDGVCDNGEYGIDLMCADMNNDGGDCGM